MQHQSNIKKQAKKQEKNNPQQGGKINQNQLQKKAEGTINRQDVKVMMTVVHTLRS